MIFGCSIIRVGLFTYQLRLFLLLMFAGIHKFSVHVVGTNHFLVCATFVLSHGPKYFHLC